ncbi:50S ribosome-binding GTPase [Magnetovirga frankeli]|uniref:GTPase n=1 Tax=Magnetovirga frankeli TaxID=947516 RepID=UPI00129330CF|nr:50S ribosome-binding GTPase [gamma proteobacterium SS-5]
MKHDEQQALRAWIKQGIEQGWLAAETLQQLDRQERQQAEDLFRDRSHRPLLVALFGGTGVGKSSLLNRLARAEIARTGLQRPTSQEVSLYLHRDFQLDLLPPQLPMAQTRIAYHDEKDRRLLAWIDMPDMDSTALANRQLVEAWLPYIDWIIYVVSPERYHDDLGWRFLQQRGQRHAWIFVMNQWDQGRPEQMQDFRQRLAREGFSDPVVLRSSCLASQGQGQGQVQNQGEDDFDQLERRINQAIQEHSLELLQQLGQGARRQEQRQLLRQIGRQLGDDNRWQQARQEWFEQLDQGLDAIALELRASAQRQLAEVAGERSAEAGLAARFEPLSQALASPRTLDQVSGLQLQLLNGLASKDLPQPPFAQALEQLPPAAPLLRRLLNEQLDQALLKPGHWLQRRLHALSRQLEWLLPLAASGWAIQHALVQYYLGTREQGDFLGLDFAIHSLLLIGLGWLIPRLLRQRSQPSASGILQQGLKRGIAAFSAAQRAQQEDLWQRLDEQRQGLQEELEERFQQPLQQQTGPKAPEAGALTPEPVREG